ncbi:unnamed protein product [Microthlaspi erraticum]|uniref:Arabidopsis retrotransposon Orf1 C-terminal domain-containing protein n=1 Tax=Microthlaspi erraticum TaxID=1685480 RepID=A0A6D2K1J7_9BRAS|nr:unnamed protein product [Microthlaspi erraticum]CAA7050881.1 unnamed protein product [Microthlaspi erraticum]
MRLARFFSHLMESYRELTCEFLASMRGNNIDFSPPLHTLVGHEEELQEEEPELDRVEDRVEDHAQVNAELGEPECYYLEEYEAPRMNPSAVAAHKRIGLLQRFNNWQGKAMDKMQKSMDKMVSKIKSLEKKVSSSSSKKKKTPKAPTFPRSRFLLTTPRRLPVQESHRASSFETREGGDNTQRRRKSSKGRCSNSISGLDRVGDRVDLGEPSFENPGFEHNPAPYQDYPQSHWTPYNRFEQTRLHQGQGSHTHFEDEEVVEEEEQARPSCTNEVEWSAPDGRLPSPDHDLASQFFGGHLLDLDFPPEIRPIRPIT